LEVFVAEKDAFVGPMGNLGSYSLSVQLVCRVAHFALDCCTAAK